MSKICIVSDLHPDQVNGVVTTYKHLISALEERGHEILFIDCSKFKNISYPFYKEIKIALNPWHVKKLIGDFSPNYIHIATEGLIGWVARNYCLKNNLAFTTSYHTKFPEYVNEKFPFISKNLIYKILKRFHNSSNKTFVTNNSLKNELIERGFTNLHLWSRGVDLSSFKHKDVDHNYKKPVFLYVGRVSLEKNLEAFLDLNLNGSKIVVGDGPDLRKLQKKYKDVIWLGQKTGEDLVTAYNLGDVFVFPSKTDTFGLVMIEANACGLPIAAYPVTGPIDYIQQGVNGYISNDLEEAVLKCLNIKNEECLKYVQNHSWENCVNIFEESLLWNGKNE